MEKRLILSLVMILSFLFMFSYVNASIFDWIQGKITGKATSQTVTMNITVGVPTIYTVYNASVNPGGSGLTEASATNFIINFSVSNPSGATNLNDSSARANFTFGSTVRQNLTCAKTQSSGNYANYTCNITLWWWDNPGSWNISISISDNNLNSATNSSTTFSVGTTTGFVMSPIALQWSALSAGSVNQTSTNDPILMNNTGNVAITAGNIQINATNLRGEIDSTKAIWAGNFSVGTSTGGNPPAECSGTTMSKGVYTAVSGAALPTGNFTINDGSTGQKQLYFCIKTIGSELTTQAYSTANESSWTIKIA